MKKHTSKMLSLVTAAALCIGQLPGLPAHAASQTIEACGDGTALLGSLTAIEHGAFQAYLRLNAQRYRAYANNRAGTADVLYFLSQEEEQEKLADASCIVISAGMMDVIAPLQEQVDMTVLSQYSDIFGQLPEEQLATCTDALAASVSENKDALTANYKAIAAELAQYDNAHVILTTVYNPLKACDTALSPERQACYDEVRNAVDTMLTGTVNPLIRELGKQYGYTVVDAYTLFDGKDGLITGDLTAPYPTGDGYQVLGKALLTAMEQPVPEADFLSGDVNHDGGSNASDAALVLIHAAAVGAGKDWTLTLVGEQLAGDVNRDGIVNASDAAIILIRSAQENAGAGDAAEETP